MLTSLNLSSRRMERQTVAFGGLDRSDRAGSGAFTHMEGLSPARWPKLSPARCDRVEPVSSADGLFEWDGHRVLAADGQLWYDGQPLCNLTAGSKQFAVVNTALVVWPDKLAVDLDKGEVRALSARAVNAGQASFTADSLTLAPRSVYARTTLRYRSSDARVPWLWSYESVAWTAEGGWVCEGGTWLRAHTAVGRYCIPPVRYSADSGTCTALLPRSVYGTSAPTEPGGPENEEGFCTLITHLDSFSQTAESYHADLAAEVYWEQQNAVPLDSLFRVGDAVSVTGTLHGLLDVEKRIVRAIDPKTNTLTFDPDTFLAGDRACRLSEDVHEAVCLRYTEGDKTYRYKVKDFTALAGERVVLDAAEKQVRVYNERGEEVAAFEAESVTSVSGFYLLEPDSLRQTALAVEVSRPVPELDYICHHDNRLWGVSDRDNCIYASALGDPSNFCLYDGLSTDSYTAAVGSEGEFTGICSYGGSVLCWKEQGLHKVLGTMPETYQIAAYTVPGVGRGSHKSLVSVDERLYYLGRDGVYAYTGSLPTRISRPLGLAPYANGVAGTDGKYYCLSAERTGCGPELLLYDPETGLWFRRDGTRAADFARSADGLALLAADGIRTLEAGEGYRDFEAVLAPMEEELDRVQYSRLRLRCELEEGAWLQVDVRRDGGLWRQAGLVRGGGHRVAELRLPLGRCGRLEIRLRGHGGCAVSRLSREYRKRGRE